MVDIAFHLGAVTRAVETTTHEGRPAKAVVATRTYSTDADDLWDALTDPERLPRWFAPVSGDLRLGGRFQIEGNAAGEVLACERPRHLSVTWEFGGDTSWVEVRLAPAGEGTTLTLRHTAEPSEHWDTYGPGAVGIGWELSLLGLGEHLATGEAVAGAAGEEWAGSQEGKDYVTASAAGWGEAAIGGGDEPDGARAAAERTAGFYRGEDPQG